MARKQLAPTTPAGWAGVWVGLGIPVVPLNPLSRVPTGGVGWQERAVTDMAGIAAAFPASANLGILTGHPDCPVADIDKDCPEAVALGPVFLPPGGLTFGRNSAGLTHSLYLAEKHDPNVTRLIWESYVVNGQRELLLELRYARHQTMAPGSIHPETKEPLFCTQYPPVLPKSYTLEELQQRCRLIAATIIVKRAWPGQGSRDYFALAVLGGLAFHGVDPETAYQIVVNAAHLAGDEEYHRRGSSAHRAKERIEQNEKTRGFGWIEREHRLPAWGEYLLKTLGVQSRVVIEEECKPRPTMNTGQLVPAQPRKVLSGVLVEPPYVPFPVEALPIVMREMVIAVSHARNVDSSMVALPALAAAATLIGTSHQITPNGDWREFCALWTMILCETGSRKSAGFEAACNWMDEEQGRLYEQYLVDRDNDADALATWKESKEGCKPRPNAKQIFLYTDDATVESLPQLMMDNAKGIGYIAEEIQAFFTRLEQYSGGNTAYFLKMYDGRSWNRKRATGDGERWWYIKHALLSMSGTIQPTIFQRLMTEDNIASGLLARGLLSMPEPHLNEYQRFPNHVAEMSAWKTLQAALWALQPVEAGKPRVLQVSPRGVDLWEVWHNQHAHRVFNAVAGIVKSADAKLWGQALRLALIDHLITCLHYKSDTNAMVSDESIHRALVLASWWSNEHARIYWYLLKKQTVQSESLAERVIRYFRRHPTTSKMTARELRNVLKDRSGTVTTDSVLGALEELEGLGIGTRMHLDHSGGPQVEFTINRARICSDNDDTPDETAGQGDTEGQGVPQG